MHNIVILSSSVRIGRKSHWVAKYFEKYIAENKFGKTTMVDLNEYGFPVFEERLKYLNAPTAKLQDFSKKINKANGIIIVTPEYNGGYPASLKNAIDVLYDEWHRKPVAIATVSEGAFGGTQVITSLQFALWKMHAWTVPVTFPVPNVNKAFDKNGKPNDKPTTDKRAETFLKELTWCMDAAKKMKA